MKSLDSKATAILQHLSHGIPVGEMRKFNQSTSFMAAVVETFGQTDQGYDLISVAHYYEMNGDLVPDPEMVFVHQEDQFYPVYFRNAMIEQFAVKPSYYRYDRFIPSLQASLTSFANTWMRNIQEQQDIDVKDRTHG